jgi:hypothetical protein
MSVLLDRKFFILITAGAQDKNWEDDNSKA